MAVKREKIHFETVEELLGAPVTKDATTEIRIDQIFPFENHPFKVIDDEKMSDLVQSIKDNGILVPVLVRPDDEGTYEMISGHRRMHAAKLAGLVTIPAIIKPMTKGFVSEHQGKTLQRQVFIDDRVKTMNESVFYNVDEVYTAINENKKIKFKYYKWDINKKLVARRNGEWFVLSPWGLTWVDENYYMIAYDEWDGKVKSYRVDKMMRISITDEKRTGQKEFKEYDMANISKATFGMYGGPKKKVKIQFENSMCGVFLDRFGKDITFRPVDENHSEFYVDVNVSQHFFGWLFGMGPKVKLVGPEEVVDQLKEYVAEYTKSMK